MTRLFCVLTLFCIARFTNGQELVVPPLKPFEVSLRMKGLAFVIIEDLHPRAHSIGFQCRFREHFGFVMDVVNFRWLREEEIPYEPGDYSEYYEVSQKDNFYYLATELRYYPFRVGRLGICMPYVNLYSKWGKRKVRSDEEYGIAIGDFKSLNSKLFDLGASFGCEIGNRFGFDANIGFCYRWERRSKDVFMGNEFPLNYGVEDAHNRFLGNMRVSFYWNFMGKV